MSGLIICLLTLPFAVSHQAMETTACFWQSSFAAVGLTVRAPGTGNAPASHGAGQTASQSVSTTRSELIRLVQYSATGSARIDLDEVATPLVDGSRAFPRNPGVVSSAAPRL